MADKIHLRLFDLGIAPALVFPFRLVCEIVAFEQRRASCVLLAAELTIGSCGSKLALA